MWRSVLQIIGLLVAILGAWTVARALLPAQRFDPAAWNDPSQTDRGVRLEMADDLIATHRLDNLTREQVVELLGTPPDTAYFSDWDLVYWLGPERGFLSIDSEWLVVRFGADQRVREYQIVRD